MYYLLFWLGGDGDRTSPLSTILLLEVLHQTQLRGKSEI